MELRVLSDFFERFIRLVLGWLLDGSKQKIYVEAWRGVGATALLREVAEAVETSEKRDVDVVIKVVQPALFRNRREMQRAVAEQLNHLLLLPPSVVTTAAAAFDAKDEDDDFSGVEFSARDLLPAVADEIYRAVEGRRVLLILCNSIADGKLVDPNDLGIPVVRRSRGNAVVWTSGMNISREAASASADGIVRIQPPYKEAALDLVYKEAVEIARYVDDSSGGGGSLRTTPQVVLRCFWYNCLLLLHHRAAFYRSSVPLPNGGRPMEAAVSWYFVCDGILRGDVAAAWEIGKALAPLIGSVVIDLPLEYWQEKITSRLLPWAERRKRKSCCPRRLYWSTLSHREIG